MPDGPRSSNEIRRGIPDGSARISSARRARMTVHTCRKDVHAHGRRFEARGADCPAEVVEALQ